MSEFPKKKTIKIPLNNDFNRQFAKDLKFSFCNSHILEGLVFPQAQDESPYEITKRIVEALEQSGCEKAKIFAFIKTGFMLSVANQKYASRDDKAEWLDAINQYEKLIKSGVIQPSDSLVSFIQDSKDVPNPKKSEEELARIFDERNFHCLVIDSSRKQFINNDFPSAVFNAYKKLLTTIQEKSDILEKDGLPLITHVFNPQNPVLQSSLARFTGDSSIQEGIIHLFMGAVLSVRNVFAHKDVYLTNVGDALEYLSFASFLFKLVDVAEVRQKKSNAHAEYSSK